MTKKVQPITIMTHCINCGESSRDSEKSDGNCPHCHESKKVVKTGAKVAFCWKCATKNKRSYTNCKSCKSGH